MSMDGTEAGGGELRKKEVIADDADIRQFTIGGERESRILRTE